ncbi:PREDICTED: uncharacterized protein LOC109468941 [Branchiostoma belcheri]|uniref:Uncharacterized protein LOC109468941 n=1 Tax=Branchiostoma belcheri TaxID=7741 RepID=A0A6P4YME9_BRABE|nr:PREDICTED: uncharacterized protein LOC109468941 [Branchiostoma belcheri]
MGGYGTALSVVCVTLAVLAVEGIDLTRTWSQGRSMNSGRVGRDVAVSRSKRAYWDDCRNDGDCLDGGREDGLLSCQELIYDNDLKRCQTKTCERDAQCGQQGKCSIDPLDTIGGCAVRCDGLDDCDSGEKCHKEPGDTYGACQYIILSKCNVNSDCAQNERCARRDGESRGACGRTCGRRSDCNDGEDCIREPGAREGACRFIAKN